MKRLYIALCFIAGTVVSVAAQQPAQPSMQESIDSVFANGTSALSTAQATLVSFRNQASQDRAALAAAQGQIAEMKQQLALATGNVASCKQALDEAKPQPALVPSIPKKP